MSVTRTGRPHFVPVTASVYATATVTANGTTYAELISSTSSEIYIYAVFMRAGNSGTSVADSVVVGVGAAASEVAVASVWLGGIQQASSNYSQAPGIVHLPFPIRVPASTRVAIKYTTSSDTTYTLGIGYADASKVI